MVLKMRTMFIECNPRPGRIYKHLNHIAIDCGCGMPDGHLATICFDIGEYEIDVMGYMKEE